MRSLTARLVATFVVTIVAVCVLAAFGILGLTRRYFVDAERRSMLVQARVAASSCSAACVRAGVPLASIDARVLPSASNISRNQQNTTDDLAVDVPQQSVQALLPGNFQVLTPAAAGADNPIVAKALSGEESSAVAAGRVLAAAPVRDNGSIIGAVLASGSLDDVDAVMRDIQRRVLAVLLAAAAGAVAVGLWRARSIARPVRDLTSAARSLGAGNYGAPLPNRDRRDELGELTAAFDDLRTTVQRELQARSAFVGDASHELRTPLTTMRGAVEILQSDAGARPEVRARFLTSLRHETDRMLELVDDLLTLNHADHQVERRVQSIDITELCRSVIDDVGSTDDGRDVAIHLIAPNAPVIVASDESALRQVLLNLVRNALVHAPGSEVTVVVRPQEQAAALAAGNGVLVDVIDNGPGIEAHDRDRVFGRFTRLDAARTRQRGGSGLGLAITRALVDDVGGDVSFIDPPSGFAGACARVRLPGNATDRA
jgi:two-component system, OmpR family, sensor kinase